MTKEDRVTRELIDLLLPEIRQCDLDITLSEYVQVLRGRLEEEKIANPSTKLASGGWEESYLDLIGRKNAYTEQARELLAQAKLDDQDYERNSPDSKASLDLQKHIRRSMISKVIQNRDFKFDDTRRRAFDGVSAMMKRPESITDRRFGEVVAHIESLRTASHEVHIHFANAFVHAWDQVPKLVAEKALRPGDTINRMVEREQSRGMSR